MVRKGLPPALCLVFASAKKLVTAIFIGKTLRILKSKNKGSENTHSNKRVI